MPLRIIVPDHNLNPEFSQVQLVRYNEGSSIVSKLKGYDQLFINSAWHKAGYPIGVQDTYYLMGYTETVKDANVYAVNTGKQYPVLNESLTTCKAKVQNSNITIYTGVNSNAIGSNYNLNVSNVVENSTIGDFRGSYWGVNSVTNIFEQGSIITGVFKGGSLANNTKHVNTTFHAAALTGNSNYPNCNAGSRNTQRPATELNATLTIDIPDDQSFDRVIYNGMDIGGNNVTDATITSSTVNLYNGKIGADILAGSYIDASQHTAAVNVIETTTVNVGKPFQYVYGVDIDNTTRPNGVGRFIILNNELDNGAQDGYEYHDSLDYMPCHKFRRCVMDDLATRHVAYYLFDGDSNFKEDGTAADLTGGDGDVMVEIPITHYRIDEYIDSASHPHTVYLLSQQPFKNSQPHPFFYVSPDGTELRQQYVGAFKGSLWDANGNYVERDTPQAGDRLRSVIAPGAVNLNPTQALQTAQLNGGSISNAWLYAYVKMLVVVQTGKTFLHTVDNIIGLNRSSIYIPPKDIRTGASAYIGTKFSDIPADLFNKDKYLLTYNAGKPVWKPNTPRMVTMSWNGIEELYAGNWCLLMGFKACNQLDTIPNSSGYWRTCSTDLYHDMWSLTFNSANRDNYEWVPQQYFGTASTTVVQYHEIDKLTFMPTAADFNTANNVLFTYFVGGRQGYFSMQVGGSASWGGALGAITCNYAYASKGSVRISA